MTRPSTKRILRSFDPQPGDIIERALLHVSNPFRIDGRTRRIARAQRRLGLTPAGLIDLATLVLQARIYLRAHPGEQLAELMRATLERLDENGTTR